MAENELESRLRRLLEPTVTGLGYELVMVELTGAGGLLRLYIDSEAGIELRDCEIVSHQVSGLLDVEDPLQGHYNLEVSSPGLDRPLLKPEHFIRFNGYRARVRMRVPRDGRRNFTGTLGDLQDGMLTLEVDGESFRLPLEDIALARLVPEL